MTANSLTDSDDQRRLLTAGEITAAAETLEGWDVVDGRELRLRRRFPDFKSALAFLNAVGEVAERMNHHPDMEIGWGRALVRIHTHSAGGLTPLDFAFAAACDALPPRGPT